MVLFLFLTSLEIKSGPEYRDARLLKDVLGLKIDEVVSD
jgi:hypothetical protein